MFDLSALSRQKKSVLLIAGATATGKSRFALECAQQVPSVVINADSMQIYDALSTLTAQPSTQEQCLVPHALYAALQPDDVCSAARWAGLARQAMKQAWDDGRLPILVGGTGLYLRMLLEGMSPVPDIDPEIRAQVRALFKAEGVLAVQQALAPLDPKLAQTLSPNDSQRLCRALEVALSTGIPLSEWQAKPFVGGLVSDSDVACETLVLDADRQAVYARCDARLVAMVESGALEEVKDLLALGLDENLPIMRAVGVPPLCAYLKGALDEAAAVALAQRDTRRFAKRQMTWLRNQFGKWNWVKIK